MKMKRILLCIFAIGAALAVAACGPEDKLIGTWQCTGATYQGQQLSCTGSWIFYKDHTYSGTINIGSEAVTFNKFFAGTGPYTWKLDASKNPMQIDLGNASDPSQVIHSIIEFQTPTTTRLGLPTATNIPPPQDFAHASLTIGFKKM
jgi:hypothetical protein